MSHSNKKLIMRVDDYKLLTAYVKGSQHRSSVDRLNAEELQTELQKAKLVKREDFPMDVVRLNSQVKIKAEGKDEILELMLVTPDKADYKSKKISILAPIGTALLGFRQGEVVSWKVPAGKKRFTILEVNNKNG